MAIANLEQQKRPLGNIIVENREKMSVSGVLDVVSFDEHIVVLETELGAIVVNGQGLHISKLSIDVGEVVIDGYIDSFNYEEVQKKGNFFGKMFR